MFRDGWFKAPDSQLISHTIGGYMNFQIFQLKLYYKISSPFFMKSIQLMNKVAIVQDSSHNKVNFFALLQIMF